MFETQEEQLINKHERKLKELTSKFDRLEGHFDQLFTEYHISKDELSAFLEDPAHFDHQTWSELQNVKNNLDQKLTQELNGIKNPSNTRNKYRDLKYSQQWIFVR